MKGATALGTQGRPYGHYFNPRSREGSDIFASAHLHYVVYFNPRSREGSDVNTIIHKGRGDYFNPRSREGSDNTVYTNGIQAV